MNRNKHNKLYVLINLVFMTVLWLLAGCDKDIDADDYNLIRPVHDPHVLQYEFVPEFKIFSTNSDFYIPIAFSDDSLTNICQIANKWQPPDTHTAVIFFNDIGMNLALGQVNLPALTVDDYYVYDFDNNNQEEVAVIYKIQDSLWLQIISCQGMTLYKHCLLVGKDSDGNGYWDGTGFITYVYDINKDGYVEIFTGCDTGYDLYPRKLICLDWFNKKIRWDYNVSGMVGKERNFVIPLGDDVQPSVIILAQSKGNAAVVEDMTDKNSYLIVLDEKGRLKWKKNIGGVFSRGIGIPFDYDSDGTIDILTGVAYQDPASLEDTTSSTSSKLVAYDYRGKILNSLDMGSNGLINNFYKLDYYQGKKNTFIITLSDKRLLIFDSRFNILKKIKFYAGLGNVAYGDFLSNGHNQILMVVDCKLWLFDDDFKILAQFGAPEFENMSLKVFKPYQHQNLNYVLLNNSDRSINYVLRLEKTAWYTIFSRKPWLAFLAGFVPLSLIIIVIWFIMTKFRQKNLVIREQRDQLNATLMELKDAQDKLIATEKYKQAKDIAGGFAHEIRNALFPAKSALAQLKRTKDVPLTEFNSLEKYTRITDQAVTKAVNLTKLISQYTRLDTDYFPEPVIISKIINEITQGYEIMLKENNIKFDFNGDGTELPVENNNQQLYLVLNNLLLNSIDALTNRVNPIILISIKKDYDFVILSFIDNGCGVSRDNINRIFETFYSTKPDKGTGLGLAFVKKVIEMYGGSVSVKSEPDKGTQFDLKLKLFKESK